MDKNLIQEIKNFTDNFDYEQYFYKKMNQMIKQTIFVCGLDICFSDFYYLYLRFDPDFKEHYVDRFNLSNKEKIQLIKKCIEQIYKNNKYDINELIQLNMIKKIFNINLLNVIPKLSFTSLERVKKTIDLYQMINGSVNLPRSNNMKLLTY